VSLSVDCPTQEPTYHFPAFSKNLIPNFGRRPKRADVRFGSKADMCGAKSLCPKRTPCLATATVRSAVTLEWSYVGRLGYSDHTGNLPRFVSSRALSFRIARWIKGLYFFEPRGENSYRACSVFRNFVRLVYPGCAANSIDLPKWNLGHKQRFQKFARWWSSDLIE